MRNDAAHRIPEWTAPRRIDPSVRRVDTSALDDLTIIASELCRVPIALVTRVAGDAVWCVAQYGLRVETPGPALPFDRAACASTLPLVVEDLRADPRFARAAQVTGAPNLRFYAGIPLVTAQGDILGTLAVADDVPRTLSDGQWWGLAALARHVVAHLEAQHVADTLRVREESLRQHSAALTAAAFPIIITDRLGMIQWVNPAFTTVTGYEPHAAIGQNPRTLLKSGVHDAAVYDEMFSTLLAGRVWRGELVDRRKDGTTYPAEMTIAPVLDGAGDVTHFVSVARDISAEKQMLTQLLQSEKMEGVGRLAGGIAHDFNNLLTIIVGASDDLRRGLDVNDARQHEVREIRDAAERGAGFIKQLLTYSRQSVGAREPVSANALVEDVHALCSRLLGGHVCCTTELAADAGAVQADAVELQRVLVNLVVNARDAMPGGGTVTMRTRAVVLNEGEVPSLAAGAYVQIGVHDTGTGMDDATKARVFEPFFTTKPVGQGTGFGLFTAERVVRQHAGAITIASTPGAGSCFTVFLPRLADSTRRAVPSVEITDPRPTGGETVLLVEDDPSIRSLATRSLTRAGYVVLAAGDGRAALQQLAAHTGTVHCVFTDLVMPGMNGRELVEQLRTIAPHIPVLVTSGFADEAVIPEGLGNDAFLPNPYATANLLRRVRTLLDAATRGA